jgi:prepilin-type N-terminal cleavage/methylation domain-containing protein
MIQYHFKKRNMKIFRSGFTLLELLVASMLMSGTVVVIAQFWRSLSLSMNDLVSRSNAAEEMRFVTENVSRDFGSALGVTVLDSDRFLICQDSGKTPNSTADWGEPDIIVEYFVSANQLRRFNQSSGVETTIADGVSSFEVEKTSDSQLRIDIEIRNKDITRRALFLWNEP